MYAIDAPPIELPPASGLAYGLARRVEPETRPRAIAPLDDGSDAAETAERLLLAVARLDDVHLLVKLLDGQWIWRGQVSEATYAGKILQLVAAGTIVRVSPASVVAVSYCANRVSSGISLSDESGAFLSLWSTDATAFDAWLTTLAPIAHALSASRALQDKAALQDGSVARLSGGSR